MLHDNALYKFNIDIDIDIDIDIYLESIQQTDFLTILRRSRLSETVIFRCEAAQSIFFSYHPTPGIYGLWITALCKHDYYCIGLSRYIAITNLPIIAVFVEYLRQFLIDLNQTYRHSMIVVCHQTRLREFLELFLLKRFQSTAPPRLFCHFVPVTV